MAGPARERRWPPRDPRLILALMGEQGAVVDVTGGIQPPLADGPHPTGVVDVQPAARLQSDCLQTDVVGARCRPVANRISSTSSVLPSSSSASTGPGLLSLVTETPLRTSTPASRRPFSMSSPTNGSIRGNSRERTSSVTDAPKPCQAVANSTPTPPAPTIASRPGTELLSVPWRFVHGRTSSMPGSSGSAARVPVHTTTACRAVRVLWPPPGSATVTRRGPANRPCPRISVAPVPAIQSA